ncbi:MAG: magnesium transporter CorA family protein [Syntrophobacteraceae bacterium]|nr:magnesium transporter CorA family protein [Syntrophobacteraceae bacterium]
MKACFDIREEVTPVAAETGAICVFAAPDQHEIQEILETLHIDRYDLESALDPDEISRVEFAPDRFTMIWKQPKQVSSGPELSFEVSSVGLFFHHSKLTMIFGEGSIPFHSKDFQKVSSATDVLLKYLFHTIRNYLSHLKSIKQTTGDLQSKLSSSMENRYLLHMFTLSEDLVYYQNAIEANGGVLTRLSSRAEKLGFSKEQIDFLDDIILENKQCARQAQIYSTVLSGLMDARGNIINNNMNVLLKNLTIINVIFLPLNLIASIGGMSEFSVMTQGVDWRVSYSVFSLAIVLIGWLTWLLLVRYIDKNQRAQTAKQELPSRSNGLESRLAETNGVRKGVTACSEHGRSVEKGAEPRKWFRWRKPSLFRA